MRNGYESGFPAKILREDSEEWQLLEKDYDEYQDFLSDMAMEEYETEKWLKQHPHTEIYKIAINL